jgi:Ca2+-binding EF-hand superfamily protein
MCVQFKKGLVESGLELPEDALQAIFRSFDGDCSGFVDFNEFAEGVRPPLSGRRKKLVAQAFEARPAAAVLPVLAWAAAAAHFS